MPKFGKKSLNQLETCHSDLQILFNEVIKHFDCVVLEGHRNQKDQDAAFEKGNSKLKWPNGNHNSIPSLAVDVAPYDPPTTVNWKDIKRFYYFGGYVLGIARILKDQGKITHSIRYGGDWDMDTDISDQTFNDLVHFELVA
jgi:peptidoglycan L-alanyl-D-glutamate endopeptidase CwlK